MTYNTAIIPAAESGEEQFLIDEMFISRTDKRGVIKSGNEVFRRVSGYEWDRLIGAPYRLIRNPDTPKAVFWLMWKTIQADKPMVAFVKNRSANGCWYWVLAVVVPLADGYLSAQIKPTGAVFAQVTALYAEILAAEQSQSQSLAPDKSGELLLSRLAELGFPTYADFAASALEQELALRDAALGISNAVESRVLASVGGSLRALAETQADLMGEFDALQSIPTNMRIIASRLEPSGGPISALSDNYKFSSTEISRRLEAFAGSANNLCQAMSDNVRDGLFLSSISRLMAQMRAYSATESNNATGLDLVAERAILSEAAVQYRQLAQSVMLKAERVSGELNLVSGEIRRMMLGLDTIRVMGRVESGRLGSAGVGLSATIDQLDTRHASIAAILQGLMNLSATIKAGINTYQRQIIA